MSDNAFHILCLSMLPKVGPSSFWKFTEHFGSAESALNSLVLERESSLHKDTLDSLRDYLNKGAESKLAKLAQREIELAQMRGIALLPHNDPRYPSLLAEIAVPPPLLYVRGNVDALALPQVAIVGSRNATRSGLALAHEFGEALGRVGIVTTSGLALGIDASAHRGSLAAGASTIAVLGNGLSSIYPVRNRQLAEQICGSGGAIVSEFALDVGAHASNFPRRNRIVSGLSCGTLVVEAALKSGSLITASYATQENREVFAIPGSPRNKLSRGCHALIKNGAKLVETVDDIVEELGSILGCKAEQLELTRSGSKVQPEAKLNGLAQRVFNELGYELSTGNTLATALGLTTSELSAPLLDLELQGLIENTGMGYRRI